MLIQLITLIGNDFNSNGELQITIREKKKKKYNIWSCLVQNELKEGRTYDKHMLFPKPVGNTAIESFLSNTFCIISFCSDLSCRWNCLSCRIRFISSSMWFVCLRMQIIWHAALSSSHHAMCCCHHSVSIARSRL
jgi:hypothetical protein